MLKYKTGAIDMFDLLFMFQIFKNILNSVNAIW